jgi:hypothetical protein
MFKRQVGWIDHRAGMLGERLGQNGFNDDRLPRVRDEDAIGTLIIPAFFNVI